MIKIKGKDLKRGLSYVNSSVGTDATAKQETGLLYFEAISENEVMFQVQGDTIVSKAIVPAIMEKFSPLKALINYNILQKYSKISEKEEEFLFDFTKIEEDLLVIKLGTKLIGKVALTPLDAFELEVFDEAQPIATVESSELNELIKVSAAFVDIKRDIRDYVQILGENNKLIFFATDGSLISTFTSDMPEDSPDFEVTAKGSVLKKIKKFESDTVKICTTADDYFLVFRDGEKDLKAVILHTDPPFTYHEVEDVVNGLKEESKDVLGFSWDTVEMLKALQSLECSAKNLDFLFKFQDNSTFVMFTEDTNNSSTRTEVLINSVTDNQAIFNIPHVGSIPVFKKVSNLNKKEQIANIQFMPKKNADKPYMDEMYCTGNINGINFKIAFDVKPYV